MICPCCNEAAVPPAYHLEGLCEDCWAEKLSRLGIEGFPPRYVALQTESPRKFDRIASERSKEEFRLGCRQWRLQRRNTIFF
jgi:hypothetical protein